MRSPGNSAYVFYLVTIAWAVMRSRRAGGFGAVWQRLCVRHRILTATLVLPLAIWFLIPHPNRVGAFVNFVVNRDSGYPLWSMETLLYYPRAFGIEYSATPVVGWIVLALAMIPPSRLGPGRDPGTLIYLAFWVGLLATAVHPYRQPRFLFTTAPIVWLLAAQRAIGLIDRVLGKASVPAWIREPAWALALAALLVGAAVAAPAAEATLAARRAFNSPAAFGPALDRVLDQAERATERPYLLGQWNGMSPALLRWHRLLTHPALPEGRIPQHPGRLPAGSPESAIAERIDALRRSGRPVIAVEPDLPFPGVTEEYRVETWADRVTSAKLRADARVIKEFDEYLPASGFRISTFRFADSARVLAPDGARGGGRIPVGPRFHQTRSTNSPVRVSIFTRLPISM